MVSGRLSGSASGFHLVICLPRPVTVPRSFLRSTCQQVRESGFSCYPLCERDLCGHSSLKNPSDTNISGSGQRRNVAAVQEIRLLLLLPQLHQHRPRLFCSGSEEQPGSLCEQRRRLSLTGMLLAEFIEKHRETKILR